MLWWNFETNYTQDRSFFTLHRLSTYKDWSCTFSLLYTFVKNSSAETVLGLTFHFIKRKHFDDSLEFVSIMLTLVIVFLFSSHLSLPMRDLSCFIYLPRFFPSRIPLSGVISSSAWQSLKANNFRQANVVACFTAVPESTQCRRGLQWFCSIPVCQLRMCNGPFLCHQVYSM